MDLESITLYLAKEYLRAVGIRAEIDNVLGKGNMGYSTATFCQIEVSAILLSHSQGRAKPGRLIQSTAPFSRQLMTSLLRDLGSLPTGY
jgi:hypothetical protein